MWSESGGGSRSSCPLVSLPVFPFARAVLTLMAGREKGHPRKGANMNYARALLPIIALGLLAVPLRADLSNGDFSTDLGGWDTPYGTVTWNTGGYAVLEEDFFYASSTLEQVFIVDPGILSLSFDHFMTSDGSGGGSGSPDWFTASLLDPGTLDPILSTPGFTDYFYRDTGGLVDYDMGIVTVSGDTVTLDLTSVAGGRSVFLALDLWGGDDGYITQVAIDNVRLNPIPAPGAMLLGAIGLGMAGWLKRRLVP